MNTQKTTDTLDGLLYKFIEGYKDAVNTEEYLDGILEKAEAIPDIEPYLEFKKIILDIRNNESSFIEQLESAYFEIGNPEHDAIVEEMEKRIEEYFLQLVRNFASFLSSSPDPLTFLEIEYHDVNDFIDPRSDKNSFASQTVLDFLKHVSLNEIKRMTRIIIHGLEMKSISNPLPSAVISYVTVKTLMKYRNFMEAAISDSMKEGKKRTNKEREQPENDSSYSNRFVITDDEKKDEIISNLTDLHPLLLKKYLNSKLEDFLGIFNPESESKVCVKWKGSLIDLCFLVYYLREVKKVIDYDGNAIDVISNCFKWKKEINEDSFKNTMSVTRISGIDYPDRQPLRQLIEQSGL